MGADVWATGFDDGSQPEKTSCGRHIVGAGAGSASPALTQSVPWPRHLSTAMPDTHRMPLESASSGSSVGVCGGTVSVP